MLTWSGKINLLDKFKLNLETSVKNIFITEISVLTWVISVRIYITVLRTYFYLLKINTKFLKIIVK